MPNNNTEQQWECKNCGESEGVISGICANCGPTQTIPLNDAAKEKAGVDEAGQTSEEELRLAEEAEKRNQESVEAANNS